jgi:hypothetical protein
MPPAALHFSSFHQFLIKKSNMSQKSPKPQKVKPSSNPPFVVEIPSQVKIKANEQDICSDLYDVVYEDITSLYYAIATRRSAEAT